MENNLPLLAIGVQKAARTEDEGDESELDRVPDELKILILTAIRQPKSICDMVNAWTKLRKVKEGPRLWTVVLNEMQVPVMFHPLEPTADDVKKLCRAMSGEKEAKELLEETLIRDDVNALKWARRLPGLNVGSSEIFFEAAKKGAMRSLAFLLADAMQIGPHPEIGVSIAKKWLMGAVPSAAKYEQREVFKFLLDSVPGNNDDDKQMMHQYAMLSAASCGKVAFLRWLAEQTQHQQSWASQWDQVSKLGARDNNLEVMQIALDNGEQYLHVAFLEAAKYGHVDAMKFALQHGFPDGLPNAEYPRLALEFAAENGNLDAVKWLLEHFEQPDEIMRRAANYAQDYGHRNVAQFLHSKISA